MRNVEVYYNDIKAGKLTELINNKSYKFEYDNDYLNSSLPPISLTLPKSQKTYESDQLFPAFINLLPEGSNREAICRNFKIDESDFFGLLCHLADGDFIGSINIRNFKDE